MYSVLSKMLLDAQALVRCYHVQNYHEGIVLLKALFAYIQQSEELSILLRDILAQLLDALEKDDKILLADLVEEGLIPLIKELLLECEETSRCHRVGRYLLEPTSFGLVTIKDEQSRLYLHSNTNPMAEAEELVSRCLRTDKKEYAVWGCGLGYHALKLYELTRGAIPIRVFEEREELIGMAYEYGVLGEIPQDCLSCEHDPAGTKFLDCIANRDTAVLMHYPSVRKIENQEVLSRMLEVFASWNGTVQYRDELRINFHRNTVECKHFVDELEGMVRGRRVIIVAGGPSVDDNIKFLRAQRGQSVIVAVSTIWRRLLGEGIRPDMVFVMDSQKRTYGHMEGVEDISTPLIVDTTAYWEFAAHYQGPKYLACQSGYQAAEQLAGEAGVRVYETGGTVTSLALEVMLRLGAGMIYLVGVDLAFPDGKSHAGGTMDESHLNRDMLHQIKAQDGTVTYTNRLFEMYRKWIEKKIRQYPEVCFYNLAAKGAYIEGTKGACIE